MKLYIAAVNDAGRSHVASAAEVDDVRARHIWDGSLEDIATDIAAMAAEPHSVAIEPPRGGVRWVHVRFPPDSEAEAWGYTPMGFHRTRTVDFDFVVQGRVDCVLDEGTIELEAGDCVILRAANHRWVNPGDEMAAMLCLLHQPVAAPAATAPEADEISTEGAP